MFDFWQDRWDEIYHDRPIRLEYAVNRNRTSGLNFRDSCNNANYYSPPMARSLRLWMQMCTYLSDGGFRSSAA